MKLNPRMDKMKTGLRTGFLKLCLTLEHCGVLYNDCMKLKPRMDKVMKTGLRTDRFSLCCC